MILVLCLLVKYSTRKTVTGSVILGWHVNVLQGHTAGGAIVCKPQSLPGRGVLDILILVACFPLFLSLWRRVGAWSSGNAVGGGAGS